MKMYLCSECRCMFDNPVQIYAWDGTKVASPCCYSAFCEAPVCTICGHYFQGKYVVTEDEQTICNDCYTQYNTDDDWM